ncbi:MAG: methyltransferase domain-containing protein [Candidatus Eutrophobiaceae bacterium]
MKKNQKPKSKPNPRTMAELADRHVYYERAVQCVEAEIDFVDDTFQKLRKRKARSVREDFCATANTACEWVRRRRKNIAYAVDIDSKVLDWAIQHNMQRLPPSDQNRLRFIQEDALTVQTPKAVDAILAMNFSYWVMRDRPSMLGYFRNAHRNLAQDGILFLDAFGGYEAFKLLEEETDHEDFTYIWDQHYYNPINGHAICKIHFRFPDGSELRNAFKYKWRIWTLPEITEMLEETGFDSTIYWEGADANGGGNGKFTQTSEGEADAGWIAYIVAQKRS